MIHVNPDTAMVTDEDDPAAIACPVNLENGVLSASLRATDLATFNAQALAAKLLTQGEDGRLRSARGVSLARIGTVELADGVVDERYHANIWLNRAVVDRGEWMGWALLWSIQGSALDHVNAQEDGVALGGIELIDPGTIRSPRNVSL